MQGKGSDKSYGREWLAGKGVKGSITAPVNIGAVFQGPVTNSSVPISQSRNPALLQNDARGATNNVSYQTHISLISIGIGLIYSRRS